MPDLHPTCPWTGLPFTVTEEDQQFYKNLDLPPPILCPEERQRRRLAFRNERTLYQRTCSSCKKPLVSIYPSDAPCPVFCHDCWWSDDWDPLAFGMEMDFDRPFFEQFGELLRKVPQIALNNASSENSEFTNQSSHNKNCYLAIVANHSEDCFYGTWFQYCKNCMDCLYLEKGERCYEVINAKNCNHCSFSQNIENCSDCLFCKDCIGCHNCWGCVNLRNKEFHILNKKYSQEEYLKKIKEFDLGKHSVLSQLKKSFLKFTQTFPHKFYIGKNNENFSGDFLLNNKNAFESFGCRHNESIKFCYDSWSNQNCYDLTETIGNRFCLEIEGSDDNVESAYCTKIYATNRAFYCSHCRFDKNIFGCVALRKKNHCILNKQYTEKEYEKLLPRLIKHMQKTGEWGQFFPPSISLFPYNDTVAQDYYPLSKSEALQRDVRWSDYKTPIPQVQKIIPAHKLPDSIKDIPDDILNWAIECEVSKKPFKIVRAELEFYRKENLPIPRKHPDIRHQERIGWRNPRKLWDRTCQTCEKALQTTFSPDRLEKVVCEECYLKAVD
ncbi:MAG: hypothetical protein WCW30_02025 [Candidatus Gracilibacteria bacterium]